MRRSLLSAEGRMLLTQRHCLSNAVWGLVQAQQAAGAGARAWESQCVVVHRLARVECSRSGAEGNAAPVSAGGPSMPCTSLDRGRSSR